MNQATASQLIRAAITAAGKSGKVAQAFGLRQAAVNKWGAVGSIPAKHIKPLCEMGGNAISPEQILEALAREAASEKAAA